MGAKEKIEEKIKKKEQEIQEHELKIREARAYIQALQDAIKVLPRELIENVTDESALRPGSAIYKTLKLLESNEKPIHINEILKGIGKDVTKRERVSLSGSLSWYVRRGNIFTRPAPNTFGLKSWDTKRAEEPPEDFGLSEE